MKIKRNKKRNSAAARQAAGGGWRALTAFGKRICVKAIIACFILFANSGKIYAEGFGSSSIGTNTAQFLKIAVGARATAMGEAYAAMADDASAIYWNTAGLIKIKKESIVIMHAPYLAETSYNYLAYAQNAGEVGAWGFSAQYLNTGSIKKTDSSGVETGSFSPYDIALTVGFACHITGYNKDPEERFVLGANGKFVRSKIINSDNTVSADIGLSFPYMFDNRFRMAVSAQNIMGTLRFDKYEYPLPLILRLGTVVELSKHYIVTADITAPKDNYTYVSMGNELNINVAKDVVVSLRSGFNTRALFDIRGFRNLTFGTGLKYGQYSIDYSLSPYGDLGNAHRISIGFDF